MLAPRGEWFRRLKQSGCDVGGMALSRSAFRWRASRIRLCSSSSRDCRRVRRLQILKRLTSEGVLVGSCDIPSEVRLAGDRLQQLLISP